MTKARGSLDDEVSRRILKHWHEAVPNDRLAHLVKDATRAFLRSLQVRLAEHGVSLGHWTFLRILWDQDGLTQRELSIEAGVMEPTTLIALRAMEALDYVTRERQSGNRKNVYVFLAARGKRLERVLVPLAEEVNGLAVRGLKAAELAEMRRCLLAMIDNLARDEMTTGSEDSNARPSTPAARNPRRSTSPRPRRLT